MTGLPPFSGDRPRCAKCGFAGAATEWCPGGRTDIRVNAPLGEYLRRRCRRCAYQWDEAVVTPPTDADCP